MVLANKHTWQEIASKCEYTFPDIKEFGDEPGDLIILGADLEPATLLTAYSKSLFPMYVDPQDKTIMELPLGWFSPAKRAVFELDQLRITRSLKKSAKNYECRINTCFKEMMVMCQSVPRHGGWITIDFVDAYTKLHDLGYAHSVEVFDEGELVGGLYGVGFANFFAGESMVHTKRDASKVALMFLVDFLKEQLDDPSDFLLDAQWLTDHLKTLGAQELSRSQYLAKLNQSIQQKSISWP